ncbi:cuticle protein 2 [Parasteatoda tepidariorum]|uniref:cuticle protein 2 n=1 Tax=Parasteatoda tepidariorum TaxID=114398 RepID=UPI00077FE250|nr:heterogeneous nuclear ribonucleoprotein U-like protein 1 [Parasteatoda tepidariorum]
MARKPLCSHNNPNLPSFSNRLKDRFFNMIALALFSCLLAYCSAQYPYNNDPLWNVRQQQQPVHHQPQHHQPQNNQGANAAPVHYVSIGQQLQGDYKFGYNTGNGNDGSFREETRNPDGSVSGAYGYIDASGKQKIIRYTAGKDGFKAEGEDIPKAPPAPQPVAPQPQYQPQPQYNPAPQYNQAQQYQPQPQYNNYVQPQPTHNYNQYTPPQQQYNNNQGSYNPYAPGQASGNNNLLSYNIGGSQQPNQGHYQG